MEYFDNAAKCLGIIFMKFDDRAEMKEVLERLDEYIHVDAE